MAATILTFSGRLRREPSRTTSRSCRTRSSLTLHRQRQVADLVEKQGAAVGLLEPAGARGEGAGEGAFLMAEQLSLDQALAKAPQLTATKGPA